MTYERSLYLDFNFSCSDFPQVFDVDWFISSLAKDVPIVKKVPNKVMKSMKKPPYSMRVPRKSSPEYYIDEVLPILRRRRVRNLTLHMTSWYNFIVLNSFYV